MSDKPVLERLQVKHGRRLATLFVPVEVEQKIGADNKKVPLADADVVLLFLADRSALEKFLPEMKIKMRANVIFWIAYPKLTSILAGDLNRNVLHNLLPSHGWDAVSQIAIDSDWSAMRLKSTN